MNDAPSVSIVVSNHNGVRLGLLEICLRSVLKIDYPNFEVIFVDNASTDGSVDFVKKVFGSDPRLRIVTNSVNSYSQGLNMGVKVAKGEYVIFFNNDLTVEPSCIEELIKVLGKNPTIKLAQCKLLSYYDPKKIDSIGESMDIYGNPVTIGAGQTDSQQYNEVAEVLSASGSASIVQREILKEVGKFDPAYFIGYEDMDLALRIRLRGYKVVFVPTAIGYHKRGATDSLQVGSMKDVKAEIRYHFNKNRIATLVKNYSYKNLMKAVPVVLFLYMLAFLYETLIEKNAMKAMKRPTAILWNIKELKYVLSQRAIVQKRVRRISDDAIMKLMSKRSLQQVISTFLRPR